MFVLPPSVAYMTGGTTLMAVAEKLSLLAFIQEDLNFVPEINYLD
jgi:hypothetical protein